MGKRELLLVVFFVILGAVVYQATAPPPDPGERGFSLSRLLDAARRELRGHRASTVLTRTSALPVDAEITEVRVIEGISELQILGEEREDVDASVTVYSNAYDEAEAKQYAEQTVLKPDRAGASLIVRIVYPREGRQRVALTLKVPSRLRARIESRPNKLVVSNVAALEATNLRGEATLKNIPGPVTVTHRGGEIVVENVAGLRFTGRSSQARIARVSGDASVTMEQGGELRASALNGRVEVESRNADVLLDQLHLTRGPIRVNAVNGTVRLNGVKAETRLDGRNAELDVTIAGAAPVSIYNEGAELTLTPPPDGFRMDAIVVDGRIGSEAPIRQLGLELANDPAGKESRISGSLRGGGPTVTIRTTRGELSIRPAASGDAELETPRTRDR